MSDNTLAAISIVASLLFLDDTAACEDYWNARMMEADDGKSD